MTGILIKRGNEDPEGSREKMTFFVSRRRTSEDTSPTDTLIPALWSPKF